MHTQRSRWEDVKSEVNSCWPLFSGISRVFINSRTGIAGAIIGLLLVFYFVVRIFVTITWRHNHLKSAFCSFVHKFNWIACVTSFSLLMEPVLSIIAVIKFLFTRDLPLSKMTSLLWNWLCFSLIHRDKARWVYVTLNKGYLRAGDKSSNKLCIFLIKVYNLGP